MNATLLGEYGTKPQPNRHLTSCFVSLLGGALCDILIDCGEGTQVALSESSCSFSSLGAILLTHLHGDHVFGLPGLLTSMNNNGREEPLVLIGPTGTTKMIQAIRTLTGPLKFRVRGIELGEKEHKFLLPMCQVTAFKVSHNVPCYGYTIEVDEISDCNPGKANNFCVPVDLWSLLRAQYDVRVNGVKVDKALVFDGQQVRKKLVYCTDTRPCDAIVEHCKGAKLAILEGMYVNAEDQALAIANTHMMMTEAATIAKEAEVENLWLTHLTAKVIASDAVAAVPNAIFPGTVIGYSGLKMSL